MVSTGWPIRLLSRLAAGLFLAWFIAISVLATASSATIGALTDTARLQASAVPVRGCEASAAREIAGYGHHAAATDTSEHQTSEPQTSDPQTSERSPAGDDCADPMAPPGDDVPPELELDLENEPWDLCSTVEVPPVAGARLTFATIDDSHEAHVPEATSPPPRA